MYLMYWIYNEPFNIKNKTIMSKKIKPGRDARAANPAKSKIMGRSHGALVFNETVQVMVTPKIDKAIKNNKEKRK